VTRSIYTMVPAVMRLAELTAQQGPAFAVATVITPLVAALVERARRSLRIERQSSMSKLISFRTLAVTVALALVAAPVAAQPATLDADLADLFVADGLTADQAATRAAAASPDVWRKAAEIEAAISEVDAAKLQRLPRVTYTLSYTRLSDIDQGELAPGKPIPVLLNKYSAEMKAVIPLSDQVLRLPNLIAAAKDGERAARIAKHETELAAGTDARLAYYEWVRAQLQLVISQRQLAQVAATLDRVRALAGAQKVSRADLLRVESEHAQAEQTVDRFVAIAGLREEALRIMIGAGPEEQLAVGEDLRDTLTAPQPASLDDLVAKATRQRLEFRRLQLGLDANHEQSLAERANQLPKLSAFVSTSYANPSDRAFPPEDEFTSNWMIGAQLTWSFNDVLTAGTTKHRLRAEASALRADRASLTHAARLEVLSAQQDVALAHAALATSHKGLVAAEEGYRVRKAQLDAERATAVELVDAETELTRARIAALDARIDLRIAITRLDHALGNDAE
jgi:outer membrane protein